MSKQKGGESAFGVAASSRCFPMTYEEEKKSEEIAHSALDCV